MRYFNPFCNSFNVDNNTEQFLLAGLLISFNCCFIKMASIPVIIECFIDIWQCSRWSSIASRGKKSPNWKIDLDRLAYDCVSISIYNIYRSEYMIWMSLYGCFNRTAKIYVAQAFGLKLKYIGARRHIIYLYEWFPGEISRNTISFHGIHSMTSLSM